MLFSFVFPASPPQGVVRLTGAIDALVAAEFRTRVQDLVDRGWTELVLDLTHVPSIDCSGLSALIRGLKATRAVGGDCRLASATEPVQSLLSKCGLDRILTAYPTVEAAMASYKMQQIHPWRPVMASL